MTNRYGFYQAGSRHDGGMSRNSKRENIQDRTILVKYSGSDNFSKILIGFSDI